MEKILDYISNINLESLSGPLIEDDYFIRLILEPIEIFGVDKFNEYGVVIKGRIKTKPIRQWEVGREFLRRIKHAFDENGIEIPVPHRKVYFGTGEESDAELLHEMAAGR